jgi:hypothetical protein
MIRRVTGCSGRSFSVLMLQVAFQGSICKKNGPRQSEQPNIAGHMEESEYPGGEPDSQSIGAACEFQGNPARRNRARIMDIAGQPVRRLSGALVILINRVVVVTRSQSRLRYEEAKVSGSSLSEEVIGLLRWPSGELRNTAYSILYECKSREGRFQQ